MRTFDVHFPLPDLVSGVGLDPSFGQLVTHLLGSSSSLLHAAGIGLLLDPAERMDVHERRRIHRDIDDWIAITPKSFILALEKEGLKEVERQLLVLRTVDIATFDATRWLTILSERKLLGSVNRLLLRAKRVQLEAALTDLDALLTRAT